MCFFQPAQKFNTRYATFGFKNAANLDEGNLWPVAFALEELTAATQARIRGLVKKAASFRLTRFARSAKLYRGLDR